MSNPTKLLTVLKECLHALYPKRLGLSETAREIRWASREQGLENDLEALIKQLEQKPDAVSFATPVDMILHCPQCHTQHVDQPQIVDGAMWTNPPHRSHLCNHCGHIWRPADIATNGVLFIQTKGTHDNITPKTPAPTIIPSIHTQYEQHRRNPILRNNNPYYKS